VLAIALISLAGSFLFLRADLAATSVQASVNLSGAFQENKGRVLGAAEKLEVMPEQTYVAIYPEYNLPVNEYRAVVPVKKNSPSSLAVFASSSIVIDKRSGAVLWEKNSSEKRSIASLTKLMTVLVFLDTDPSWGDVYKLKKEDVRVGGKSYIYVGDEMTVRDLFYLTLVGSDNTAAVALAKSTGLTEDEFIAKMNAQAKEFGLKDTFFRDISGLSEGNVSTAKELLILAKKSLAREKIREATLQENYEFKTIAGRKVQVNSTDYLLSEFPVDGINIFGGKTGHTEEAGYCFIGDFKNEADREIISIVMGTNSNEGRFVETKKLVKWAYDNFTWN
jgi:D-alanyl-D-alanine carboxypeptidase (penicillin-binding protein 5/6)